MGVTYLEGIAIGPVGEQASVEFLVDGGATYTLLPHQVWQQIGLTPRRSMRFRLADGTAMERSLSECQIRLPQGEGHTPVILGEEGDTALLGAITLEEFGLVLNPFTRQLQPMQMLLA